MGKRMRLLVTVGAVSGAWAVAGSVRAAPPRTQPSPQSAAKGAQRTPRVQPTAPVQRAPLAPRPVPIATPALSRQALGAPEPPKSIELRRQLQALRLSVQQQAARYEAGELTAAQVTDLQERLDRVLLELSSINRDVQAMAAELHVPFEPRPLDVRKSAGIGQSTDSIVEKLQELMALISQMGSQWLKDTREAYEEWKERIEHHNSALEAISRRIIHAHDLFDSGLTPRPVHPRPDLVLDSLNPHTEGRIRIKMHNQGGSIRDADFAASFVRVTVNDSIEKDIYFKDIDPNGLLKIGETPAGSGINRILMEYIWPATGPNGIALDPGHTYKVKVVLDVDARILDGDRSNNEKTVHLRTTP